MNDVPLMFQGDQGIAGNRGSFGKDGEPVSFMQNQVNPWLA